MSKLIKLNFTSGSTDCLNRLDFNKKTYTSKTLIFQQKCIGYLLLAINKMDKGLPLTKILPLCNVYVCPCVHMCCTCMSVCIHVWWLRLLFSWVENFLVSVCFCLLSGIFKWLFSKAIQNLQLLFVEGLVWYKLLQQDQSWVWSETRTSMLDKTVMTLKTYAQLTTDIHDSRVCMIQILLYFMPVILSTYSIVRK